MSDDSGSESVSPRLVIDGNHYDPDAQPGLWKSVIELVGWIGVILYIGAYVTEAHGLVDCRALFVGTNTVAAVCVGIVSYAQKANQSVFIQLVWIIIGVSALMCGAASG